MKKEELSAKMSAATEAEQRSLEERKPPRALEKAKAKGNAPDAGKPAPTAAAVSVHDTTPRQTEQVFALLSENPSPGLVLYGGKLHRIAHREGQALLEAHTRESLLGHIGRAVVFVKRSRDDEWHECNPPARLMDDILSLPDYPDGIPCVRWIKSTPILTADGRLVSASGLYPEHQTYLALDPALEGIALPEKITEADLAHAAELLLDPFQDLPVEEESVANLVALLFTMVFREWIEGVTPLFIIDANVAGTGKGLLASALSMIAFGREMDFSPANVSSDELRKRLFAVAAQGAPLHILDNIEQTVWSPELAAWLTAPKYSDRKLGESAVFTYPNTLIILGTGNNVALGGDIRRRVVLIRMVSAHARPEERADFRYPNLVGHVQKKRRSLLQALYTVAAAWLRAGRAVPQSAPQMGSFQPWADFSAGILDTLGAIGLLDNRYLLKVRDQDAEEYETMLSRTRRIFGTGEFTAKELAQQLDGEDFPSCIGARRHGSITKSLGRMLTRIEGRAFGDEEFAVRHHRTVDKTKHYRIESREDRAAAPRVIANTNNETMED